MDRTISARESIISVMRTNPGIHFRELQRRTGIATGQIQYHLYQLEKSGLISVREDGKLRRYFLIDSTGFEERKLILYLRSNLTRPILYRLMLEEEIPIPKIVKKGRNSEKVEEAINMLESERLVKITNREGIKYMTLANPELMKDTIRKYKQSFLDTLSLNLLSLLE